MLASNFKAAKDLGLTEEEQAGLVGVLHMLERGELIYVAINDDEDPHSYPCRAFNMGEWRCGSIACIAGWSDRVFGTEFQSRDYDNSDRQSKLLALFVGDGGGIGNDLDSITTDQAAQALRNYLTHGDAKWGEVSC